MANIEKRVSSSGEVTYRVKVRLKGFPVQTATFDRLTDAKRWGQQTEAAIREGRHFKTSAAKKHTFANLVDRYIRDVLPLKPKSIKAQKTQLLWWKENLGAYLLSDITPALIIEARDKLKNSISARHRIFSNSSVNRYLAVISHAFTVASKEWCWLDSNPVLSVSKMKEPRGRVRYLSEPEREQLIEVCKRSYNPYLYPVIILAVSTGMRQGEIMNLKWEDINFDKQFIVLHETKNGDRRRVPLVSYAHDIIYKMYEGSSKKGLLFPNSKNEKPIELKKAWNKAIKEADIKDFRFHDLRHTTASYLAMNGASTHEIAEVLGHKTLSMVKRYSHISESHTSKVVEKMNNKIFG